MTDTTAVSPAYLARRAAELLDLAAAVGLADPYSVSLTGQEHADPHITLQVNSIEGWADFLDGTETFGNPGTIDALWRYVRVTDDGLRIKVVQVVRALRDTEDDES